MSSYLGTRGKALFRDGRKRGGLTWRRDEPTLRGLAPRGAGSEAGTPRRTTGARPSRSQAELSGWPDVQHGDPWTQGREVLGLTGVGDGHSASEQIREPEKRLVAPTLVVKLQRRVSPPCPPGRPDGARVVPITVLSALQGDRRYVELRELPQQAC